MKIPKCVDTAEALKEYISAEKILHSFAKAVKKFVNYETYSYCEEYGGLVKENDYCGRIKIDGGKQNDL